MQAEQQEEQTERERIKCTNCKKKFYSDGFGENRFGDRYKTCLECSERRRASKERSKCPHGKQKSKCVDCKGTGICEHNKVRSICKECKGGSLCVCGRPRSKCDYCKNPEVYCNHNKPRLNCRVCVPKPKCKHNQCKYECTLCHPEKYCGEHMKMMKNCYKCNGQGCEHKRNPKTCFQCRPSKPAPKPASEPEKKLKWYEIEYLEESKKEAK